MSEQKIFDGLDPEIMERVSSRRDALLGLGRVTKGVALASMPLAFAALAKNAFAQTALPAAVVDILKFALTLERLESNFYMQGVASNAITFPAGVRSVFTIIRDHEAEHVQFLEKTLMDGGASLTDVPSSFDFTAGGKFPDVFSNYATFVTLSTAFEDTGVRAYKGQAPNLIDYDAILTAALKIHSVEARHASKVRRLAASYAQQGWIPLAQPGAPMAVAPVYAGEDNVTQAGVNVANIVGNGVTLEDVTEAFDEPLTKQAVLDIVTPFLA